METVNDIINEWRGIRPDCDECLSNHTCDYINRLIDRLDAAFKRDMQSIVDAGERDLETLSTEFAKKRKMYLQALTKCDSEIARLKAALKPVLEVRPRIRGDYVKYKCWDSDEMMEAIVESQRIYSGGAK